MRRNDGFALIAALWLLVALSTVALTFAVESRDRRLIAANRVETVRARAAAEAGLEHASVELERRLRDASDLLASEQIRGDPWRPRVGLGPYEGDVGDVRYRVEVADLGARLNVNRVDEATLRRFLVATGLDAGRADRMAQTVLDWRDPDDLPRTRGAEREAYEAAGSPRVPANRPFLSVDEIRWVEGVRSEDFRRLEEQIAIRGSGRVNLSTAPLAVLLSLPGMHPTVVREIVEDRRGGGPVRSMAELVSAAPPDVRTAMEAHLPELVSGTTPDTRELLLTSEGWVDGSPTRTVVEAVLVRSRDAVFLVERSVR